MQVNPFIRPVPGVIPKVQPPPPVQSSSSPGQKFTRGMDSSERADSIKSIANDIHARTARIQHLKIAAQKMQEEIKKNPQAGSSRIAYLAKQLDKDF
ncbi:MAG: hypothetical protein ACOYUZ_04575 [Patescibacteria group bacterium]